ncbi:flagellar hook-length control protein FliK [Ideonella sp. A 288]|uniref:flagellar hook-length control protein FliK n=1 Tax=Ideonella sp. A 288 TaxID=1962181 RepID=UPI000B4B4B9D|nr:flagellar hook-length control protein FliK [Ideonella sp. A 288]
MMPALSPLAAISGPAPQPLSGGARSAAGEGQPPGAGFSNLLKKASAQTQPVVRDTSARPPARPADRRGDAAVDDPAARDGQAETGATAEAATDPAAQPTTADAWRPPPPTEPTTAPADGLLAAPPMDGTDLAVATAAMGADTSAAATAVVAAAAERAAAASASAAAVAAAATAAPSTTNTAVDAATTAALGAEATASAAARTTPSQAGGEFTARLSNARLDGTPERRTPVRAASADAAPADLSAIADASTGPPGTALTPAIATPSDPADPGLGRSADRAADSLPTAITDAAATASQATDAAPLAALATPPSPTGTPPALAGGPAAGSAHAPVEARVPVPVTSPEFAPAFGLQISTLARDGIEHARLQLNPADLGPITVRIAMDGTGARIDFQADAAVTRQAIESSLPALAGSLREAGLTLTGGGVSQQPQDRPADPRQAGASGRAGGDGRPDAEGADALLPRPVLAARRGLVDLVA